MSPAPLSHADLSEVVRLAPLISIDLIVRNSQSEVLLGLRNNQPAKGFYFVPGGRIWKGERLRDAFTRILRSETNCIGKFDDARALGVYEHFYATNRFGESGYGTHYVVLAYALGFDDISALKADAQHSDFCWWDERALLASERVHENTKAYFR
jgi:colanic acid biosynthesis protein WcaH